MKGVKDAVSREMLDCEIQALTKLKHPNILRCYEVIREPTHCYIITEFCEQGDLSSLLKKKRKMPESEVLSIMKDIVSGYLEIGENKFLHRDLKLANILMNQKGLAKIADFGFAKKSLYTLAYLVPNLRRRSITQEALSICHRRHSKETSTQSKMIFGPSESWFMRCFMAKLLGSAKHKPN